MERKRATIADLTAEQRAEFEAMRAETRTPAARREDEAIRAAVMNEFPPATLPAEAVEALARIRVERERLGMSLADVSDRTGIDRTALSKLERGQGNPTLATLNRVAAALGMRVELSLVAAQAE